MSGLVIDDRNPQAEPKQEFQHDDGCQDMESAQKGHTVLAPQPSTDPNDPLNWSPTKKTRILLVISVTAFLPDFGSSMGAVTSVVQSNLL